jgi:hypothetical protein
MKNTLQKICATFRPFFWKICQKFGRGFFRPLIFLALGGHFCVSRPKFRPVSNTRTPLWKIKEGAPSYTQYRYVPPFLPPKAKKHFMTNVPKKSRIVRIKQGSSFFLRLLDLKNRRIKGGSKMAPFLCFCV